MARIRTRDDGLGEFIHGDILRVKMHAMDAGTTADEVIRRELFDERMRDAHMHRPGFRTSTNVRPGISRADAVPAIEAAYRARWQDDVTAWRDKSPAELLSEAKRVAEDDPFREGRGDPSDRRSRRQQSERPFEHELPDDDEGVCPHCGRGCRLYPDDDRADDFVCRQTQTHHEGTQRLDQLRRDHAARMTREYALQDAELSRAWRKG